MLPDLCEISGAQYGINVQKVVLTSILLVNVQFLNGGQICSPFVSPFASVDAPDLV